MDILAYIRQSQNGDSEATLFMIEKFKLLLKKYAWRLHYEDAYEDLQLEFLTFLQKFDPDSLRNAEESGVVQYIVTSVQHSYYKLLQNKLAQNQHLTFSDLGETSMHFVESLSSQPHDYVGLEIDSMQNILSPEEHAVIRAIYVEDKTIAQIARENHVSRQAINQMKKRAMKKLKNYYA